MRALLADRLPTRDPRLDTPATEEQINACTDGAYFGPPPDRRARSHHAPTENAGSWGTYCAAVYLARHARFDQPGNL